MRCAPERILIVDEYGPSRVALAEALGVRGHECAVAETITAALALMPSFAPTVVLVEPAFRDGSGVGVSARFRACSRDINRRIAIVALSYANEPPDLRGHFDAYLVKPASIEEVEGAFAGLRRLVHAV